LAEYLGHGDPGFTLRLYTHMLPSSHERARKAVHSRLARLFSLKSRSDLRRHLPDAHAGDRAGDYQALDLARAFEDGVDLFPRACDLGREPRMLPPTCSLVVHRCSLIIDVRRRLTEQRRNMNLPLATFAPRRGAPAGWRCGHVR
jgi:hypothetical protein